MCQLQTHPLTDEDSVPGWIFYFSLETAKLCILHKLSIVKCKKNPATFARYCGGTFQVKRKFSTMYLYDSKFYRDVALEK